MIGLLFFIGIGLWLTATVMLCKRIPRWLGATKHSTALSVVLFPVVLVAPIADELVGRWQFYRLCDREAVVTLSPDWEVVKRARVDYLTRTEIGKSAIPIYSEVSQYVDVETNKVFLTIPHLYTYGGVLFGRLGLGLGGSTSCWPDDWMQVTNKLDIDQLIKQGKAQ
jgi:hypothetical protein